MTNFQKHYSVICIFFLLGCVFPGQLSGKMYNVKDHGISGENIENTARINQLIRQAHQEGGGTILFPSGHYLTGAIELKSNISLVIEPGAVLTFSGNFDDYPFVQTRWSGVECMGFSPLIYANGAENISVTGLGTIDGNGFSWWERQTEIVSIKDGLTEPTGRWEKKLAELNKNCDHGDLNGSFGKYWKSQFLRPPVIQFYNCSNVILRDISIQNSPFWTVHPVYCDNVTIDNIKIYNPPGTHNTDGINPESSKNVRIINCLIAADDDCITLKSGRDSEGRRIARPCENITISNCLIVRGYGGITIGSEMSGGVKNVVVTNCIINNADWGIRIKTQRGRGGVIENIMIDNVVMENVKRGISINTRYNPLPPEEISERTPVVKNIRISGCILRNVEIASEILGLEEMPIDHLSMENMTIDASTGLNIEDTRNMSLRNIILNYTAGPAVKISNSSDVGISQLSAASMDNQDAIITLKSVADAEITSVQSHTDTDCFLKFLDSGSRNIYFNPGNTQNKSKVCSGGTSFRKMMRK